MYSDHRYLLFPPPHSPGSVIYSDEWRAYSRLPTLPGQMYTHHTVNHSVNCVDPVTGAHTQMVERMWGGCKGMMRQQKTMHSRLFDTYLQEFMWKKQFDGFGQNAFYNTLHSSTHFDLNPTQAGEEERRLQFFKRFYFLCTP